MTINIILMIYEHIMSIESNSNSFNATCGFNTKAHSSKKEIVIN